MTVGKQDLSKKRTLWVITELYFPENNQTGYYLTHIAEGLAEDFDVRVLCGQPNYAARGTRAAKRERHNNVEIFRIFGTTLDKDILLYRLINMLTHGSAVFFNALFRIKKRDLVLTVSAPPSLPFITAFAAKLKGADYVCIIQDKYPETLFAVKKAKPDSFLINIFKRLNRWMLFNAKKVVVVGRDMKELVLSQIADEKNILPNLEFIPNWASLEEIEPRPKDENKLLQELGLSEKFVFLYAGNMGHPQDVESIVECAEKLKEHKHIRFLFIGGGFKRKWLERVIVERDLQNLILLGPRPREEQIIFLNACDVGFVSLVRGMWGVAMPSRTYNFLAAGKPILALTEKNSEVERVLEEENVGWTVSPQNSAELLKKILEIYEMRDTLSEMGRRARRIALEKYSADAAIKKYRKVLKECI